MKGCAGPAPPTFDWKRGNRLAAASMMLAHATGAAFTFVYLDDIAPGPHSSTPVADVVLFVGFVAIAFPLTGVLCDRSARRALRWMIEGREPTLRECKRTLTLPRRLAVDTFLPWAAGAAFFTTVTAVGTHDGAAAARVGTTIFNGGLVSCTISFLLLERVCRDSTAKVLAVAPPEYRYLTGVRLRLLISWALGSAVPLLALLLLPAFNWGGDISLAVIVLSSVGILSGLVITVGNAKAVGQPIREVRRALQEVQDGRLDVEVTVDRNGDLGLLQAGVNQMVAGLRERERLADLFGRHVGTEVATLAIAQGSGLESEQRDASVLFVDIIGSTALAEILSPEQVVGTLNAFFDAVVRVVENEGGWVNKFEGDGALCMFGAPAVQPDHAGRALRAARTLQRELRLLGAQLPGLDAAIGVSSGVLVAGNVGTETRYEYTVIGRPVNEAARLTELAKTHPSRVLAGAGAVTRCGDERPRWSSVGSVVLRGQSAPGEIFEPASAPGERLVADSVGLVGGRTKLTMTP